METTRQKKIAGILQQDLSDIISRILRDAGRGNVIVSVTKVRVTPDLLIAKAYLSVFPAEHAKDLIGEINNMKSKLKHQVALKTKNQLRRMPELTFYNDDTLEYIEQLEKAAKGENNPLENKDLLKPRKKK
ncbi:ribosome-binding factor A [Psychroflexus salis]|uniref:Ribosome-binding factor A n=1 Tax=Psychroflexus salis TaxID=1526574 RepID=A0A916ZMY7_9FLAO|nr:ribosome-binding factor A [Psychroflexus salis]GGE05507.1 ribosome-binding factor A [Psychroflexus salis]